MFYLEIYQEILMKERMKGEKVDSVSSFLLFLFIKIPITTIAGPVVTFMSGLRTLVVT